MITREAVRQAADAIAAAAAEFYADLSAVIWKGSSWQPWDGPYDFLPGLSDIDIHVYRPGGLEDPFGFRAMVFDRAELPDTPLQLIVMDPNDLPDGWQTIPGTYEVLIGEVAASGPSDPDQIRELAAADLRSGRDWAAQIESGVVDRGDDQLWGLLRRYRWMPSQVLRNGAVVAGYDIETVWRANRTALLRAVDGDHRLQPVAGLNLDYLDAARRACGAPGSPRPAETALRAAVDLLKAAADWVDRSGGTE